MAPGRFGPAGPKRVMADVERAEILYNSRRATGGRCVSRWPSIDLAAWEWPCCLSLPEMEWAVMARTFCTLEEAAGRLCATVDELESMLAEGLVQEFRDGPGRFLRSTDVQALAVQRHRQDRTAAARQPTVEAVEGATVKEALAWRRPRPRPVTPGSHVGDEPVIERSTRTSRRPKRPGLRSWRRARRQGLWAGVLDDRPLAILAAFTLVTLVVGGFIAGTYFLLHGL